MRACPIRMHIRRMRRMGRWDEEGEERCQNIIILQHITTPRIEGFATPE